MMPAPNLIGGTLPWGQAAGGANLFQGMGGTPQQAAAALGPNYANAYQSALAMNQQNYSNILAGYQQTAANQADAADSAAAGYTGLTNSVLDRIKGVGQAARTQLGEQYDRAAGLASQGLVNRGLGNTTVANSVQAGIDRDRSRAMVDLQDTQANRLAGYESQLGQAGLASRQHYADQGLNLSQNQLGWMNSVNAGYPNAGMYGQLAEQFGRMGQANADRDQAMQIQQRGSQVNPGMAGIPPPVQGGGRGFFDNPTHDLGIGGYAPPALGAVGSAAAGNAAKSFWDSRITPPPSGQMGPYGGPIGEMSGGQMSGSGASALGGAAGAYGLADQYGGPAAYAGEGQQAFGGLLGGAGAYAQYQPAEEDPWALASSFFEGF